MLEQFGAELAWVCESDPAASKVLEVRHPGIPNLGDITKVNWETVVPVQVVCGGFPCQDVSTAGRRVGLKPDTRSGLWSHMALAIAALRPQVVVVENVRGLLSARAHSDVEFCEGCMGDPESGPWLRALGAVLGDLSSLGFDAEWQVVSAADAGSCHLRERVFVLAWQR